MWQQFDKGHVWANFISFSKNRKKWSRCCFVAPRGETNKFWESLSNWVSNVALMFQILRFAVKMSVHLAASQARRVSVWQPANGTSALNRPKVMVSGHFAPQTQLKASLLWAFCLPTWGHTPDCLRPIWSGQAGTGKHSQHEKSQSQPWSAGMERKWRLRRGKSIIFPATGSFNLTAYRKSLIWRSRLSAETHTAPRRSPGLTSLGKPLIMFGSCLLFLHRLDKFAWT